ncbi:hypothetical protein ALC57_01630 [Trachymyrmex cornetzi]|uniref:Uncharacterized protein n=1 Tax=Trachymyrmex cornetzi TaxID=471704 RepID=A0A195EL86_9HYME|nr:hypothetical protein ALC57_01630 [Trachymyrmex cornetzi]
MANRGLEFDELDHCLPSSLRLSLSLRTSGQVTERDKREGVKAESKVEE